MNATATFRLSLERPVPWRWRGAHFGRSGSDTSYLVDMAAAHSGRLRSAGVAEFELEVLSLRTRAGMARARRPSKHIGRPRVTARPGFEARRAEARTELTAARISRSEATRRLGIGYATVLRLLAAEPRGCRPDGDWHYLVSCGPRRPCVTYSVGAGGRVRVGEGRSRA